MSYLHKLIYTLWTRLGVTNNVPIYIGEWGAASSLTGYVGFHQDKAELYRDWGANSAIYTWKHNTSVTGGSDQWGIYSSPLRLDEPLKLAAVQVSWSGAVFASFSNNIQSTSNSGSPCINLPPIGVPDLFQIDRYGDKAILYFAPAITRYTSYYIGYGLGHSTEQFGVEFPQGYTTGVISFTINFLDPKLSYSFKVRAGNSCTPGDWGNTLQAGPVNKKIKKSFYRVLQSNFN